MASPVAASYTKAQKALHWITLAVMIGQYFIWDGMGRAFHQLMDTGFASYSWVVIAHLAGGLAILALALVRLRLRAAHGRMAAPATEPEIARKASALAHLAIYATMVLLPLGGLIAWFGAQGWAAELHEIGANLLLFLLGAHAAAVLVHQFHWKTNLIARMT